MESVDILWYISQLSSQVTLRHHRNKGEGEGGCVCEDVDNAPERRGHEEA
jgi:hypothetical protein